MNEKQAEVLGHIIARAIWVMVVGPAILFWCCLRLMEFVAFGQTIMNIQLQDDSDCTMRE